MHFIRLISGNLAGNPCRAYRIFPGQSGPNAAQRNASVTVRTISRPAQNYRILVLDTVAAAVNNDGIRGIVEIIVTAGQDHPSVVRPNSFPVIWFPLPLSMTL